MTIEIIHEFIDCYPSHQMSKFCTSNIQSLRTGTTSTFDFTRVDQFMIVVIFGMIQILFITDMQLQEIHFVS